MPLPGVAKGLQVCAPSGPYGANEGTRGFMLSTFRIGVVCALLAAAAFISYFYIGSVIEVPMRKPLRAFPTQIGPWELVNQTRLTERVEKILGAADYIYYDYATPDGKRVNLYVSYFSGGHGGFHSPQNCLPGAGWNIIRVEPLELSLEHSNPRNIQINKMVIRKGAETDVVFYWYQRQGRVIRSEYGEKLYGVLSSLSEGRRDGAFIRIMAPVVSERETETAEYLQDFTRQVVPLLSEHLPGP